MLLTKYFFTLVISKTRQLAWEDIVKETNLENGKFHSKPKNYFKALGSLLNTNQTTQSYPGKMNSFD